MEKQKITQLAKYAHALLIIGGVIAVMLMAGCGTGSQSGTNASAPVTATTGHQTAKPTATLNTGGYPTVGGPVADFEHLRINGNCPGAAASRTCFCGSLGDSNCDYIITVKVAESAVTEVDILGLTKKESWDINQTLTTCIQYMGGASVATVGGQVSKAGFYDFVLGSRQIILNIAPGSCQITLGH